VNCLNTVAAADIWACEYGKSSMYTEIDLNIKNLIEGKNPIFYIFKVTIFANPGFEVITRNNCLVFM